MPEEEAHEKWRADPLAGVFFGLILIVAAGVYFFRHQIPAEPWWSWVIAGIGCVFLLEAVVRSVKAEYKRPSLGRAVWGIIFIAVGMGFVYGFKDFWPMTIIAIGIVLLLYYIRRFYTGLGGRLMN